jgi:hypothetical protein
MPTLNTITSTEGNMEGVHIEDATTEALVLFATNQTGAPPSGFSYQYTESATPCVNYIANLKIGIGYSILTSEDGGTRTVTINEGGPYTANSGGLLVFDPATIGAPTDFFIPITDGPLTMTESVGSHVGAVVDETLAFTENVSATFHVAVDAQIDETLSFTENVVSTPTAVVSETLTITESVSSHPTGVLGDTLTYPENVQVFIGTAPGGGGGVDDDGGPGAGPIDRSVNLGGGGIDREVDL